MPVPQGLCSYPPQPKEAGRRLRESVLSMCFPAAAVRVCAVGIDDVICSRPCALPVGRMLQIIPPRNDSPTSFAGRRFATTRDYCPPVQAKSTPVDLAAIPSGRYDCRNLIYAKVSLSGGEKTTVNLRFFSVKLKSFRAAKCFTHAERDLHCGAAAASQAEGLLHWRRLPGGAIASGGVMASGGLRA